MPLMRLKRAFDEKISIDQVNFSYEDEKVLKNFSIEVPKGKTVALVGQSGSGKSTIANLITRFYDVQKGSISMDGIDIKKIKIITAQPHGLGHSGQYSL